jgi:hypothetical protein
MVKKSTVDKYTIIKVKDAESFDINNPKNVCALRLYDDIEEAKKKCKAKNIAHPDTPYGIYILRFELQLFKRYRGEENE